MPCVFVVDDTLELQILDLAVKDFPMAPDSLVRRRWQFQINYNRAWLEEPTEKEVETRAVDI